MAILRMVRADGADTTAESGKGIPLPIIAATAGRKADGVDLADLPWDFSRGVPTDGGHDYSMLWVHDLAGRNLPIGVVRVKVGSDGTSLDESVAVFDPEDEFAVKTERKYRSKVGGLTGFSVTWEPVDADGMPSRATGKKAVANQLIEVSAVPVPLDPASLAKTERAGLASLARSIDAALGDGSNQRQEAEGSLEEKQMMLAEAAREKMNLEGDDWAYATATFPDTVVMCVYRNGDHEYFEFDYSFGDNGSVTVSEPRAVEVKLTMVRDGQEAEAEPEVGDEVDAEGDAPDEEPRSARADVPEEVAGAMLAIFDRGSNDSDAERKSAYQRLLPKYRVMGWEPPEFVTAAELRALDDSTWRTLFLAGELQRVGAEISARNTAELREVAGLVGDASKRLSALLDRVTSGNEEREAEGGTNTRTTTDDWKAVLAAYLKETH